MTTWDAIVLAGGAASRLGGGLKPAIPVAGRRMLDRVLMALTSAGHVVVVGPPELDVGDGAVRAQEQPPGGGPVRAIEAGLAMLDGGAVPAGAGDLVVIVGGDLPLLRRASIDRLAAALTDRATGVIYVDGDDRPQWLCGMWRAAALRRRLVELAVERGTLDGASLRHLLGSLPVNRVWHQGDRPPPYFDCDTDTDIRRAEEWLAR